MLSKTYMKVLEYKRRMAADYRKRTLAESRKDPYEHASEEMLKILFDKTATKDEKQRAKWTLLDIIDEIVE